MASPAFTPSTDAQARTDHAGRVTTTDLWKFAALVFVLVDHYGLFFAEDEPWWRVVGRLAAPIFFFLIGFARTRAVPWTWLALGLLLTATDVATADGDFEDVTLNILLNFALIRWALPWIERVIAPSGPRTALFAAVLAALVIVSGWVIEYGTEGWLWALSGLLYRRDVESRPAGSPPSPGVALTASVAAIVYQIKESADYDLAGAQAITLSVLLLTLTVLLLRFRRACLSRQPSAPLAALLRFCGRRSLEIYAVTLFAMQVLAYALDAGDDGET